MCALMVRINVKHVKYIQHFPTTWLWYDGSEFCVFVFFKCKSICILCKHFTTTEMPNIKCWVFFFHRNILQCIFIINEHAFIWNEVRQMKCNASVLNRIVSWSRCDLIICLFTVHMTHLELAMQFHFHYQLFVLTVQFYTVYTSFKK